VLTRDVVLQTDPGRDVLRRDPCHRDVRRPFRTTVARRRVAMRAFDLRAREMADAL
jgi:hypothetical protein